MVSNLFTIKTEIIVDKQIKVYSAYIPIKYTFIGIVIVLLPNVKLLYKSF